MRERCIRSKECNLFDNSVPNGTRASATRLFVSLELCDQVFRNVTFLMTRFLIEPGPLCLGSS